MKRFSQPIMMYLLCLIVSGCSCSGSNEYQNSEAIMYSPNQFYALPQFQGVLTQYVIVGQPDNPHENSGPIIDLYIDRYGENIVVRGFAAGKDAIGELDAIQGRLLDGYPFRISDLRDSILTD